MRLSVIVPFYNVETYLERCVNSIVCQGFTPSLYEILLIDDGSTDGGLIKAYELARKHKEIKVFTQENRGPGAARNYGVCLAKGDYLFFVDADDYLCSNVLQNVVDVVYTHNLDICVTKIKVMKSDGSFKDTKRIPFDYDVILQGGEILLKGYRPASVCAQLYKRSFLICQAYGFLEGIMHEDVDFEMKLYSFAQRVMFLDVYTYIYYWNNQSTDRKITYEKMLYSIKSDIIIADDLKNFSSQPHLSESLSRYFDKNANSLIVSLCYSLLTSRKMLHISDKMAIVRKMQELKLLPIRGFTNSKKADRMKIVLNRPCFFLLLLRFQSLFYSAHVN